MTTNRGIHVGEEHSHLLQVIVVLVIHDLPVFILRRDAGQILLLGLGNAQLVVSGLDTLGEVSQSATRSSVGLMT